MEIKTTTTVIKLILKCSPVSEGNICIAELFLLKVLDNDVRSNDTIRSVIAFAIRWQQIVQ